MKLLKFSIFFILLSVFNLSFALDAPQNLKLDNAGEDFLEISWDNVEGASVYSISYGENSISGTTDDYEHQEEIVVSENHGKIEKLQSGTDYYVAVRAYDDNENASEFSEEAKFTTNSELESLKLEDVSLIDTRNIELKFNLNLKKDSLFDVSIKNNNETGEVVGVEKYEIDGNVVKVFLSTDLVPLDTYKLVVIALEGENGELIKEGVNGSSEFSVPENIKKYTEEQEEEMNSAGTEETQTASVKIQENDEQAKDKEKIEGKVIGGKVLEEVEQTTEKTAKEIKKMPQTGPAQTALFLVFAFIASALFLILRKKINS